MCKYMTRICVKYTKVQEHMCKYITRACVKTLMYKNTCVSI